MPLGAFRLSNYAANPVAAGTTSVIFDGTGDYYEATSISTSATDNQYFVLAATFYRGSTTNLQHLINVRLGTGSGEYSFYVWINGSRMQVVKVRSSTGATYGGIYETAENSITNGAWNHIIIYYNSATLANSKIYVNGVSKAFTTDGSDTGSFNWGNTASTIKIGQKDSNLTGSGADFNGRIAQLYLSNSSTAPTVSHFYDTGANKPKDLGTAGTSGGAPTPLIYHYGDTTTFPTNRGSGFGSYTLTATGNVANSTGPTYA